MDTPAAEVDIDEALVARLVSEQHPDLLAPVTFVANGWDNAIFRLGDRRAVRMPRRAAAVPLIRNEQRWLPKLAHRLPVPIPVPLRAGIPTPVYPWPWSITPWLDGRAATALPLGKRTPLARPLADFFGALHTPAPTDAPVNPVRGVPLASRSAAFEERVRLLRAHDVAGIHALWRRLVVTAEHSGPPLWLHGDPHPANLLVGAAPQGPSLAAVVDFGDLAAGDPATDLAIAWLAFDVQGRRAFFDELARTHDIDDALVNRARGWALHLAVTLTIHADDNPDLRAIGEHGIHEVLAEM